MYSDFWIEKLKTLLPFESLFTLLDQQQPLLRQMTHRVRVEVVPHTTNTTKNTFLQGLVNYAPLTLFGFCAILLDVVFEAPSAINCLTILNSADWTKMPESVIYNLIGVRQHYNLVIAYALVKGACIALQVREPGIFEECGLYYFWIRKPTTGRLFVIPSAENQRLSCQPAHKSFQHGGWPLLFFWKNGM